MPRYFMRFTHITHTSDTPKVLISDAIGSVVVIAESGEDAVSIFRSQFTMPEKVNIYVVERLPDFDSNCKSEVEKKLHSL